MRGTLRPVKRPHRQRVFKPLGHARRERLPVLRPVRPRELQEEPRTSARLKVQRSNSHSSPARYSDPDDPANNTETRTVTGRIQ